MRGPHVTVGILFYNRIFKEAADLLRKLNEHPSRIPLVHIQLMVYSGLSDRPGVL